MTPPTLELPEDARDCIVIASVSGGKDSTAMILALREAEIPARYVFADTGWEAPETLQYIDLLRTQLAISIDVVGLPGGMPAQIEKQARFPSHWQRWCTRDLKLLPLRRYHDHVAQQEGETVAVVGIRREEATDSNTRGTDPPFADDEEWGGYVWRPLLDWTIEDVIAIHHRHNLPVNPLYKAGFDRVGCYPCIYWGKEAIRLMADRSPYRISAIRQLETTATDTRRQRQKNEPGRYDHVDATFFQTMRQGFVGIDEVVKWARTDRGGRQYPLLPALPTGGCMRWGLCDLPKKNDTNER